MPAEHSTAGSHRAGHPDQRLPARRADTGLAAGGRPAGVSLPAHTGVLLGGSALGAGQRQAGGLHAARHLRRRGRGRGLPARHRARGAGPGHRTAPGRRPAARAAAGRRRALAGRPRLAAPLAASQGAADGAGLALARGRGGVRGPRLGRRLRAVANPARLGLLAVLLALAGWVALADATAPFGRLSWLAYDTALQWLRPAPERDPRIVIVDIDDRALQAQGRWPWPRERLAQLVESIQAARPTMIGLDILLPESGDPRGDRRLARALAADNLVTATAFAEVQPPEGRGAVRSPRELAPHASLHHDGEAPALGHITPQHAQDGHIRWLYPRICRSGGAPEGCRVTLSLALLERLVGLPVQQAPSRSGSTLCVANFCQWLDARQRLLIPFQHPSAFDYLSAAEVLDGRHRERLAGKLVLVGTSAAGLGDLVATPRGALTPGVALHATLLAAWLDSHPWRPLPHATLWQLLGLAALGAAVVPLLGRRRARAWQWFAVGTVAAGLLAAPPLLGLGGWWLDPWTGWLALLTAAVLWLGWQRWQLWRRHRRLYRTFGAYVPRTVLRRLADTGGERRFAPQRRRLVILFSDIRGFTALSERLAPERLTELTNHVFTELTEVVHAHGGTLDKYIGDALMAFWGAPLARAGDDERALDCALAMLERLRDINRWCDERGYPPIAMNIGLEAGEVTVGNLGSRQRLAYTALGPAVNLASRLEELAGSREEPVLLGPELGRALAGTRALAELPATRIKGIEAPVSPWKPAL
ncbi:adenylate/guanylate cyclase domain-containing protein [Billgrantia azerbaijanica]|nr:adenylate/guanylate cyclase domain-containing protein [Halomonas azerbaijanica]